MKFQYRINHEGKLYQFHDENRLTLLNRVEKFYNENEMQFNSSEVLKSIDRQSKYKIEKISVKKRKTLADVIRGATAVIKFAAGKSASHSEIQRRSKICEGCPLKESTAGCQACGAAEKVRVFISSIQKIKKDVIDIPSPIKSKFCDFCGCSIPLLVVTRFEDFNIEDDKSNSRRPDICWLKKSSPNFTKE